MNTDFFREGGLKEWEKRRLAEGKMNNRELRRTSGFTAKDTKFITQEYKGFLGKEQDFGKEPLNSQSRCVRKRTRRRYYK